MAAALYRTSILSKPTLYFLYSQAPRPSFSAARELSPAGFVKFQQCDYSTEPHVIKNPTPSALKRGTGGRSSFSGMVATVFGASGFVGKYVVHRLGRIGTQLILPYRGDAYDMRPLKLVGDLGQVLFQPYQLKDEESIRKCMQYSNVVINLIGREWETKNFSFNDVHVKGARLIARLARESGVETFIHVSALNASEHPEEFVIKGGSKFLASKWEGERAVLEEFPGAIVFRPADIYGQEDRFLKYFVSQYRRTYKVMPLYKMGDVTEKQPVFVSDVAEGIAAACKDRSLRGEIIQAVGPNRYKLSELVDWFHRLTRRDEAYGYRRIDARFDPFFLLKVALLPKIVTSWPLGNLHWEKFEREIHSDKINPKIKTLEDLGVNLTYMENQVPWELMPYKYQAYYDEEVGEFEPPGPPRTVSTA